MDYLAKDNNSINPKDSGNIQYGVAGEDEGQQLRCLLCLNSLKIHIIEHFAEAADNTAALLLPRKVLKKVKKE